MDTSEPAEQSPECITDDFSAYSGDIEKMKKLLDSGADPNKRSGDEKRTALHWAAFYPFPNPKLGDPPKLKALLSMLIDLVNRREVDINSKDINDDTPLHIACMRSNNVAIPILLSCKDVLINKRNKHKGWTPLHRACQNDNERVAELLMKKKPNCLKRCNDGMTPLHLACQRGHDRIANVILSLCSDEDRIKILAAKDKNSYTPLHIACEKNDIELADILLKHDADPNMFNEKNLTPLFIAAKSGFVKILKLMLKRGPIDDIKKCTDNHKHNALHIACKGGHARAVKLLLEYDAAEITACNKDGLNPFEIAIKKEQKDAAMAIVNSEKWRDALMNVTTVKRKKKGICHRCNSRGCVECNNNDAYTQFKTPMRRAIKKMPADVVEAVFDCCYKANPDDPNFEFLEDFDSEWLNNRIAPVYSIQNDCLHILANSPNADLLQHPLATALLDLKWKRYGKILYYSKLMFYILFLILLTSFALTVQSPNSNLCMKVFENDNDTVIDCFPEESLLSQRYVSFVSICLIFYSLIMLLSKLLAQLILRRWQSILEVFLFIFIVIFAFVRSNQCYCTESWQWQIGVIAVFFSWIVLIFSIRRLPVVGIYVVMYITILYNLIRKVVVLALLLVFAFAFPFYMIFYDIQGKLEGIRTPFNTPWRTIYKTITMAAGHLRLDSLLHQDNQINSPDVQYPVVAFSLLIVFVVLMPILFINLLTSLAVGDIVQEIEKKSDTYRLRLKLEFTLPVEKFLRFKIMKKFKDSLDLWQTGNKKNSDKQELSDEQKLSDKQKLSDRFKKYINDWSKRIEISTKTELPATIADVKNHIKPLSEEVKDLNNSVDQLLSIVRSMRNESPGRRNI